MIYFYINSQYCLSTITHVFSIYVHSSPIFILKKIILIAYHLNIEIAICQNKVKNVE